MICGQCSEFCVPWSLFCVLNSVYTDVMMIECFLRIRRPGFEIRLRRKILFRKFQRSFNSRMVSVQFNTFSNNRRWSPFSSKMKNFHFEFVYFTLRMIQHHIGSEIMQMIYMFISKKKRNKNNFFFKPCRPSLAMGEYNSIYH